MMTLGCTNDIRAAMRLKFILKTLFLDDAVINDISEEGMLVTTYEHNLQVGFIINIALKSTNINDN